MSGYKTSADCWWDQTRGKKRRVSRRELKMWGGGGDGGEEVVMVTTSPAAGGDDVTLPIAGSLFLSLSSPPTLSHMPACATWRRHAGTKPVSTDSTRPINIKRPLWAKTCCSLISLSFFNEQIIVAFSVFFRTTDACSFKRIHCS